MNNFCPNCGEKINEGADVCLKCGKNINNNTESNSKSLKTMSIIVGILFPLVGAILYYVFKKDKPELARIANRSAWIGFILYTVLLILRTIIFV